MAWDAAKPLFDGKKILLENEPRLATQLNNSSFPRSDLDEDSYIAIAGVVGDGASERIASQLMERFPGVNPPTAGDNPNALIAYAYLEKNAPFAAKFKNREEPLRFQFGNDSVSVANFGFVDLDETSPVTAQVVIHDYRNKDDFVIRLKTWGDDIVLAKVKPMKTMADTLESVRVRTHRSKSYARPRIETHDTLIIPKINFAIDRRYTEIIGRAIVGRDLTIAHANQVVKFLLNEAGARMVSEGVTLLLNGHEDPDGPRDMRLDKPFLLFMQESADSEPYLAVWFANDELLVKK